MLPMLIGWMPLPWRQHPEREAEIRGEELDITVEQSMTLMDGWF